MRGEGCTVSIESAGPNIGNTNYVSVAPNKLRGLAAYVIQKCPVEQNGHGGFVTLGMAYATAFVSELAHGVDSMGDNNTYTGAFSKE